jgi:hypothetical protein
MAVYLQLNSVGQPLAELKANSYIVTPLTPTSGDAPLITGVYSGGQFQSKVCSVMVPK